MPQNLQSYILMGAGVDEDSGLVVPLQTSTGTCLSMISVCFGVLVCLGAGC